MTSLIATRVWRHWPPEYDVTDCYQIMTSLTWVWRHWLLPEYDVIDVIDCYPVMTTLIDTILRNLQYTTQNTQNKQLRHVTCPRTMTSLLQLSGVQFDL